MAITVLKLQGLKCPLPVLRTRKALAAAAADAVIEVQCTDPMAAIDIPSFVQQAGHQLEGAETRADGLLVFRIRKTGG